MSDVEDQVKTFLGSIGYRLLKRQLKGVTLRFDAEQRKVLITKDRVTRSIRFSDIERVVNE